MTNALNGSFTSLLPPASSQPAFLANATTAFSVTGDGTSYTIPWSSTAFDTAGTFNTSTGYYAIPEDGLYLFSLCIMITGYTNPGTQYFTVSFTVTSGSGSVGLWLLTPGASGNDSLILTGSVLREMSTTQSAYITIQGGGGAKNMELYGSTISFFSGIKVD